MELAHRVEQAIRRGELLAPGMRVACACSGGADSVALVRLLYELKDKLGLRLLVAHLNHQLRGAEANADEEFVRRLAERLEIEFIVRREDVGARAKKEKVNLEEAGREARLDFFASLITAGKADAVAVAHTLDDQAETVLTRLVRGAGTRGLAGIYPVVEPVPGAKSGRLVRPLLGVRRAELRDYLDALQQPWREDASNRDRNRLRNRIRLKLLPQLAELAGPGAVEHLGRLADHARQEETFWAALIESRFEVLAHRRGEELDLPVRALVEPESLLAKLPARQAREAHAAVARRLLRRALAEVRGDLRRILHKHVESILHLAAEGQSGQRVVLPGVVVEREFDRLVMHPDRISMSPHDFEIRLDAPQAVRLPDGHMLEIKLVAVSKLEPVYNGCRGVADGARMRFPLRVRNWRAGDRFRPAGSRAPKKLKTLFQQERIPVAVRARLPLVVSGDEIVWVARLGVAAGYELTPASQTALVIEEREA
ncbi:MAG TPA: tRNA lysidine(34) synthetase TilS [Candidatus Xenobia bacterium]|nr:tRNA lysidine(34) synthetase TilS [Candidatus Xenobia bacterium]